MITQALVNSFLLDILQGVHTPRDNYHLALYIEQAQLDATTQVYTPKGEVIGDGYEAGGIKLAGYDVRLDRGVAILDWADPVWPMASITARGALIYNRSKGNKAVAVLDLGKNYTSTNGEFRVILPEPNADTALVRIGA